MFLSPIKNITYKSELTLDEIYSNFSNSIITNPVFTIFKPLNTDPNEKNHNQYRGTVSFKGFRVQRRSGYNANMIIKGTFKEATPFLIKVSYRRWHSIFFLLVLNIFLSSAWLASFYSDDINPWLILGLLLVIFIINIVAFRIYQYEIAIFERFLEKTIQATRVSKKDAS